MPTHPKKLPKLTTGAEDQPVQYGNVWIKEMTTGPERLVIGANEKHIELITALMNVMPEPFGVLYILDVSHCGHKPGRYELNRPLSRDDAEFFLWDFQTYLEQDARHQIWIASSGGKEMIVYDQHDLIYVYGSLDRYLGALPAGFIEGKSLIPVPHNHHYNTQFSLEEDRIMAEHSWTWYPLQSEEF